MEPIDLAGAPQPAAPVALPVFSAQSQITWKAMEIVEWNAQSCELWQSEFVACCKKEWVEPLWKWCNQIYQSSAEGHTQLQQSLDRQEEQWESVRATLSDRVQKLEPPPDNRATDCRQCPGSAHTNKLESANLVQV